MNIVGCVGWYGGVGECEVKSISDSIDREINDEVIKGESEFVSVGDRLVVEEAILGTLTCKAVSRVTLREKKDEVVSGVQ